MEGGINLHLHHELEALFGEFGDRHEIGDRGIVDQNVDGTECGLGLVDQHLTLSRLSEICFDEHDLGTRQLAVRPSLRLADAALFTTTPFLFSKVDRPAYDRVETSARFARYGCDCYAYCMVAGGHADLVVESELQNYDVVALIPPVAGG